MWRGFTLDRSEELCNKLNFFESLNAAVCSWPLESLFLVNIIWTCLNLTFKMWPRCDAQINVDLETAPLILLPVVNAVHMRQGSVYKWSVSHHVRIKPRRRAADELLHISCFGVNDSNKHAGSCCGPLTTAHMWPWDDESLQHLHDPEPLKDSEPPFNHNSCRRTALTQNSVRPSAGPPRSLLKWPHVTFRV